MASIMKKSERKYKITVSNGYRVDGKKISKAKTIVVPDSVGRRGIAQYVAHAAEEFERSVKNGYSEYAQMTFEKYSTRWLERQTKYAPSTLESYRRKLRQVYPHIGHIRLDRLRPIALENLLAKLRKRTFRGNVIREETVQKYLTTVSAVLSDAKRNEIIRKNPARMVDLPDTKRRPQFVPTDAQARNILDILANEDDPYKTYYALAIYSGCRRGELCALKWSDITVNDSGGILTVSRSRSIVPRRNVVEGPTKNKKPHAIYLYDDMVDILRAYYHLKKANGIPSSDYVFFTNDRGDPIHPDTFTKRLRRLYDENGFPKEFHLHTLRHYFVTTLLHSGVDKQTVAELAGHGDTAFLERTYCHPQMALKQSAAAQMDKVLFGLPNSCPA